MDITNLGQPSKNDFTNNQDTSNNIIRKLELQHQHQKPRQCCLDIASRNITNTTIDEYIRNGCKSRDIVQATKQGDIAYLNKYLTKNQPYMINEPYSYNDRQYTLLYIAVVNNQLNTIKYLVGKGAHLDCRPNLLTVACKMGRESQDKINVIHYLLAKRVGLAADYNDIIDKCISCSQMDILKLLISHGIKPNFSEMEMVPILKYLVNPDKIEYWRYFLENNLLEVDKEYQGLQLIHIACMPDRPRPSTEVFKLLLEYGANPNARTKSGKATPLHFLLARKIRCYDSIGLLLENGADDTLKGKINSQSDCSKYTENIIKKHKGKYKAIELVAPKDQRQLQEVIDHHKKLYLKNKALEEQKAEGSKKQSTNKQSLFFRLKDKFKAPSVHLKEDKATPSESTSECLPAPSAPPYEDFAITSELSYDYEDTSSELPYDYKDTSSENTRECLPTPSAPPYDYKDTPSESTLECLPTPSAPPYEYRDTPSENTLEDARLPEYSLEPNFRQSGQGVLLSLLHSVLEPPPPYEEAVGLKNEN
jgi:ankyrin repeat protein